MPLYRQSAILARETGIELSRATLDGWVMRVGELLSPIAAAMGQELLKGDYIQADESPVDVQMHDGHGRLRCFQSCAFHLIVVAVQHLPVCIHKVHLAVAACKLVA